MSLLISFFTNHLIPALESALIAHEPEEQAAILEEVKVLADQITAWIESKLAPKSE